MKQVQIENCSSINAIKLRQDITNATATSVFENIKENISTDFDINVDKPKKKQFSDQKSKNKDNITKLNDINIKLSSNNNSPNKCNANNNNLVINNNKSHNNPLKIKDNIIISKVNNDNNYNNNNRNNNSDNTNDNNNNGNDNFF